MVPGVIGYIPEYRGVTRTPRGGYWALWAQVVEEERRQEVARDPPCPNPNWEREGGGGPPSPSFSHLLLPLLLVGIGKGGKTYLE